MKTVPALKELTFQLGKTTHKMKMKRLEKGGEGALCMVYKIWRVRNGAWIRRKTADLGTFLKIVVLERVSQSEEGAAGGEYF